MNKKPHGYGVIFNKDLKRYKCKKYLKDALYIIACLLLMFAAMGMFVYALITQDY